MSCQTEVDFVSKEEHDKLQENFESLKKEFEKLRREHNDMLVKSAEERAKENEVQLNSAAFDEDTFREVLRKTLPMDFRKKNCPNCVVIIDCFEIFIDRSSDLLARAQTYSSYKHHNTVKFLIGITPQGSVSFISDGWGGRVSDKHITENSNFLSNLIPGDTILADRGFDIKDSLGLYSATVTLPAFTKGKKQLEGIDVEQTRTIANVRIDVERVICTKFYKLHSQLII